MFERVLREERDDLVGASESAMRALVRCQALHLFAEQQMRAGVAPQIARDEVEERGLAGAVGADDEPALACFYFERDAVVAGRPPNAFLSAVILRAA